MSKVIKWLANTYVKYIILQTFKDIFTSKIIICFLIKFITVTEKFLSSGIPSCITVSIILILVVFTILTIIESYWFTIILF